jgi:hypothetical protein
VVNQRSVDRADHHHPRRPPPPDPRSTLFGRASNAGNGEKAGRKRSERSGRAADGDLPPSQDEEGVAPTSTFSGRSKLSEDQYPAGSVGEALEHTTRVGPG